MKTKYDPKLLNEWSSNDIRYWTNFVELKDFYNRPPLYSEIEQQIKEKKENYSNRKLVCDSIKSDYDKSILTLSQRSNLALLEDENTFTICIAHQPNLFGGPLYFLFKIVSGISLATTLTQKFPSYRFVPIYYCGEEDHDFAEINHINIFNQKIEWQKESTGPVGRNTLDGISECVSQLKNICVREKYTDDFFKALDENWSNFNNYHDFYFWFINTIFGESGLLFFSPDKKIYKYCFKEIILKELNSEFVMATANSTISKLEKIKFDIQARPREINLFYIDQSGARVRIVKKENHFETIHGEFICTLIDINNYVANFPEKFNANVMLRPLYQEFLLPNIVFIGGGAEVSYWLELKDVFQHCKITYPILSRRFSGIIIDNRTIEKINSLQLQVEDFFASNQSIKNNYIGTNSTISNSLKRVDENIQDNFEAIGKISALINEQLSHATKAELVKLNKEIQHIFTKLQKAEKSKYESDLQKIDKFKEQLFPNNSLQERFAAWIPYYLRYGKNLITEMLSAYDLEDNKITVFNESQFAEI